VNNAWLYRPAGHVTTERYRFATVYLIRTSAGESDSYTFRKPQLLKEAVGSKLLFEQVAKRNGMQSKIARHRTPSKRNRKTSHPGDPGYGMIDAYRRILRDGLMSDGVTANLFTDILCSNSMNQSTIHQKKKKRWKERRTTPEFSSKSKVELNPETLEVI
jgi:hypothetical protein